MEKGGIDLVKALRLFHHTSFMVLTAALIAGCGSGAGTGTSGSGSGGNSMVTLVGTSSANDQLSYYDVLIESLSLTDEKGATVSVLASPLHVEFIHLNGTTEPLATVSLPQGTYTSATATLELARFDCVSLNSAGAIDVAAFVDSPPPPSAVTVKLSAPVKIGAGDTTLLLNLLVSQSAFWTACAPPPGSVEPYSISPTFALTASTDPQFMTGLEGRIAATNAETNTVSVTGDDGVSCVSSDPSICNPPPANGPMWQLKVDAKTDMQGSSSAGQLEPGMAVDIDGTLQSDGSLLASRISVVDANPTNVTGYLGPALFISSAWPDLNVFELEAWGPAGVGGSEYFNFAQATFQVSGQFADLQSLPFTASFTGSNLVDGQRILVTSHATSIGPAPTYAPATTVTLLPQTINGTVTAISSASGFSIYTVTLAPYDLFPELAKQAGQNTLLHNPNTVMVYLSNDSAVSTPVAVGDALRFYGLVFNDGGVLKMDCASVSNGVAE